MLQGDISDYFILSIATHDGRAIPKSVVDMKHMCEVFLKRKFILNLGTGTGLANTRQKCMDGLKALIPNEEYAYTFWLDSDITINESLESIAKYIIDAEKLGVSFTANYKGIDASTGEIWNTVWKDYPVYYTDEELRNANPLELKCWGSGLGLSYIKMPIKYEFREQGHYLEDYLLFKDNPKIDLRYARISNTHHKSIHLNSDNY
jgi:hypothetical protein